MTYLINGCQVNINDKLMAQYRAAMGLSPDMKTDEQWFMNSIPEASGYRYDCENITSKDIPELERMFSSFLEQNIQTATLFGGAYFR